MTSSLLFTALSFIGYPLGSLISIPLLASFERKYLIMASARRDGGLRHAFAVASGPALIVVFGLLTTAAANVFSNIYHVYQAEIFPSDVRATAVGWTYSLSRLSSAALPFVLIPVLDTSAPQRCSPSSSSPWPPRRCARPDRSAHHRPEPGGDQPGVIEHILTRPRAGLPEAGEAGTMSYARPRSRLSKTGSQLLVSPGATALTVA